jgi:hypothetical protein
MTFFFFPQGNSHVVRRRFTILKKIINKGAGPILRFLRAVHSSRVN